MSRRPLANKDTALHSVCQSLCPVEGAVALNFVIDGNESSKNQGTGVPQP